MYLEKKVLVPKEINNVLGNLRFAFDFNKIKEKYVEALKVV